MLIVDDGTPFTAELASQLSAINDCRVVVLTFGSSGALAGRVCVPDRTEATLQKTLKEVASAYGTPAGFIYQHSALDQATANEHTQLRWALLAAKHLSPALHNAVETADGGAPRLPLAPPPDATPATLRPRA